MLCQLQIDQWDTMPARSLQYVSVYLPLPSLSLSLFVTLIKHKPPAICRHLKQLTSWPGDLARHCNPYTVCVWRSYTVLPLLWGPSIVYIQSLTHINQWCCFIVFNLECDFDHKICMCESTFLSSVTNYAHFAKLSTGEARLQEYASLSVE